MTPTFSQLERIRQAHAKDWRAEDVTFRGAEVLAVVNDNPSLQWRDGEAGYGNGRGGNMKTQLLPKGSTTVTIGRDQLEENANEPRKGEFFLEGGHTRHRIQDIHVRKLSWLCLCEASPIT